MLNTLIDVEKIPAFRPNHADANGFMVGVILNSFDRIWERAGDSSSDDQEISYLDDLSEALFKELNIPRSKFVGLIETGDWYDPYRFILMNRLIELLNCGYLINNKLEAKLKVVSILAVLLEGLPTYLDGTEFTNFALFTSLRCMNNQVLLNPTIQNHHQFQSFISQLKSSFNENLAKVADGKCNPERFVAWADEVGVSVSMVVIHALIIILNRHTDLKDKLEIDLINCLKFIV